MKVKIDKDTCVACETCVDMCPDVFEMQDDVACPIMEDIPEEFQDSCREAAESCPVEAITIDE